MKYVVVNNNKGNAKYYFYVHKEGCKNIPLEAKKFHGHTWNIEGEDVEKAINYAVEVLLAGQDYSREYFLVSNCLK